MLIKGSLFRSKKLYILTMGGGVAFWAASIATSLLPIAAQYRASFSNRSWNQQIVWVGSLPAGMLIACAVSYALLRFIEKNPAANPIHRSTLLGFITLLIAEILIDVPQSFLHPGTGNSLYPFLTGGIFNAVRFLLLGFVIGCLYKKLYKGNYPSSRNPRSTLAE